MYEIEIKHDGLNKYKIIRGSDSYVVRKKAEMQVRAWDEMWEKKKLTEEKNKARENAAREKEEKKALAEQLTNEAIEQLESIEATLLHTLEIDDTIDWDSLKDNAKFLKAKPGKPKMIEIPEEPNETDEVYKPKLGLIDKIIPSQKQKKNDESKKLFKEHHDEWLKKKEEIIKKNEENQKNYDGKLKDWNEEERAFIKQQNEKKKEN